MKVGDVMSQTPTTTSPGVKLRDLWQLIFKKNVNALPVVDPRNRLIGIVTKDDLLQKIYPEYGEFITDFESARDLDALEDKLRNITKSTARDIMCRRVIFTRLETPALRALSRMITRHVNQLPVLSSEEKVIGMVTKGDIFRALFEKNLKKVLKKPSKPSKIRKK